MNIKKKILKLLGHKWDNRFTWGEFIWHPRFKNWELSLRLTDAYEKLHDMLIIEPLFFSAYIYIPTKFCVGNDWSSNDKNYGFYVYERLSRFFTLVFQWGKRSKHIEMPWAFKHESTELLTHDGNVSLYKETRNNKLNFKNSPDSNWDFEQKLKDLITKEYKYTYKLKNDKPQERIAKVYIDRMTWKMRGFPWIKKIRTGINVNFNDEVGERTGSWKGGCIGCGYDMLPNETAEQCLRRMEKERKF